MSIKLTFAVEMHSDYHISAGHGLAAEADSALLKDVDGIPVVRGTTLVGLLRDGLWRLLQLAPLQALRTCQASGLSERYPNGQPVDAYCGQFHPQAEDCPICRLFGTPRRPRHWRIASARPASQEAIRSSKMRDGKYIVHRVRIDPTTRRAEPRKLFSQEEGDGRLVFRFTATCVSNDSAVKDEAALLVAAARIVRQLGRSRRRGQGECLLKLEKVEGFTEFPTDGENAQTALLAHFEQRWLNGIQSTALPATISYAIPAIGSNIRFRLVIRTDEPLLIAKRAEAGNQFASRPVISGATVRGAFAWLAARRHGFDLKQNPNYQQTVAYQDFVKTFLRGDIHFPYLYPADYYRGNIYPTIPTPMDMLTCKVFSGLQEDMHGVVQAKNNPDQRCQKCDESLEALGAFISLKKERTKYEPKQRHEMHVHIQPQSGRAAEGDLFTYVALEAGQYFIGELASQDAAAWARFLALTGLNLDEPDKLFSLQLGKASQRGYGRVTAWLQPLGASSAEEDDSLTWIQFPIKERVPHENEMMTLTLLTDTIVPDIWGRFPSGFESDWLSQWFGLQFEVLEGFAKTQIVDGFNAHLGLPRWRDLALVAGSVAYIRRSANVIWPQNWRQKLALAECNGIGLRCDEGFGRIAFNHPVYQPNDTIRRSDINLPPALQLKGEPENLLTFKDNWRDTLNEYAENLSKQCSEMPFSAVARWLHANQNEKPADLKDHLSKLGDPDDELKEAINSKDRKGEYGNRDKPNRLTQKKEGIKLIYALLEELEKKDSTNQSTGIRMLAERIAEAVTEKGEQR